MSVPSDILSFTNPRAKPGTPFISKSHTALRAAAARGIKVRPVSMIRPMQSVDAETTEASVVEYRTVKAFFTLKTKMQPHDEEI